MLIIRANAPCSHIWYRHYEMQHRLFAIICGWRALCVHEVFIRLREGREHDNQLTTDKMTFVDHANVDASKRCH